MSAEEPVDVAVQHRSAYTARGEDRSRLNDETRNSDWRNHKESKMGEQRGPEFNVPDPVELSKALGSIADRSQKIVTEFLERQATNGGMGPIDPLNIGNAFLEMTARMMTDPAKLVQAQMNLWQDYLRLWQTTTQRIMGGAAEPIAEPEKADRRFKDPAWEDNQLFDFIQNKHLLFLYHEL